MAHLQITSHPSVRYCMIEREIEVGYSADNDCSLVLNNFHVTIQLLQLPYVAWQGLARLLIPHPSQADKLLGKSFCLYIPHPNTHLLLQQPFAANFTTLPAFFTRSALQQRNSSFWSDIRGSAQAPSKGCALRWTSPPSELQHGVRSRSQAHRWFLARWHSEETQWSPSRP